MEIIEQVEESIEASSTSKKSSKVWDHFWKLPLDLNPDSRLRAKCKDCRQVFLADSKSGTSNLKCHRTNKHSHVSESGRYPIVNHELFRELIAKAIVRHNLPFAFVEYEGIREIFSFLNPTVKTISRNTSKVDVLKLYQKQKEKVHEEIAKIPSRVCLTTDLWTSVTLNGYFCLTAHFVDLNWILQKRVLIFRHVPPPHNGQALGPILINFLKEWEIEKKIFSITLDNASYNEKIVDNLKEHLNLMDSLVCDGDFVHIRCANHILNLIVKAGLKSIETSIFNIRESIKYVKGSESRIIKFVDCIKNLGLKLTGKVRQDVPTRWNYTYLMLKSAIPYRRAFFDFKLLDADFKCCPSEMDWNKAETITKFLKPFDEITTLFSENQYPTANLFFHKVWKIHLLIMEEKNSQHSDIKEMAKEMEKKFSKYWQEYTPILSLAVVLDPRYKLKFVKFCFSKLDSLTFNEKVKVVEDNLHRLFEEYMKSPASNSALVESTIDECNPETRDEMDEFDLFASQPESSSEKTQLQLYLEEPVLDRKGNANLDVLKYWKDNMNRYPELSLMALDVLSIPISTVASESTFSIGG